MGSDAGLLQVSRESGPHNYISSTKIDRTVSAGESLIEAAARHWKGLNGWKLSGAILAGGCLFSFAFATSRQVARRDLAARHEEDFGAVAEVETVVVA